MGAWALELEPDLGDARSDVLDLGAAAPAAVGGEDSEDTRD